MGDAPSFQPLVVFRLMALPAELRRRVYYFAVVEPHPLPLMTYRFHRWVYGYGVEKNLRMLHVKSSAQR